MTKKKPSSTHFTINSLTSEMSQPRAFKEEPANLFANLTLGDLQATKSTTNQSIFGRVSSTSTQDKQPEAPKNRAGVIFGEPATPTSYSNPTRSWLNYTKTPSAPLAAQGQPFTSESSAKVKVDATIPSSLSSTTAPSLFNPNQLPQQSVQQLEEANALMADMKKQFQATNYPLDQDLQQQMVRMAEALARLNAQETKTPKVFEAKSYTQPFCDFLTQNPTVFHAVDYFSKKLVNKGFKKLSERHLWSETLEKGGKYFIVRNDSSLIAFTIGNAYKSGNGVAMVASHIDALTARLKPVSTKKTTAGYVQLGVAPYAGALNTTWWDRDLSVGGRVLIKDSKTGAITSKLVKLDWPIARIPTLAPHFGVGMLGQNNAETQAVPIIGLDNSESDAALDEWKSATLGSAESFAATQPPKLLKAIANEISIQDYSSIINWELELYDSQPAQVGGLEKEFIFAGRVDDKLCSWSAIEGLLAANPSSDSGIINLVGLFDDEEIGSLLRQGARGNFLPSTVERIVEAFNGSCSSGLLHQTYANSFLVSADVTHAVNPNFLSSYLENHAPRLNVGMVVSADSNGHMTTDSVSTALMTRIAEKTDNKLQVFMIRNDSRSGGTVGPMLSSVMGVRAIDMGIPQLSMHSIRATTGSLDPGLGVKLFAAFFDHFEQVDKEFE